MFASEALLFSKLATLELCGWIEVSMDDIVLRHSRRTLREPVNRAFCEKRIVKPIYGFDYDIHFRKMLMGLIGLEGVAPSRNGSTGRCSTRWLVRSPR